MMKNLKDFNVIHLNLLSLHLVALYIGSGKVFKLQDSADNDNKLNMLKPQKITKESDSKVYLSLVSNFFPTICTRRLFAETIRMPELY